MENNLKNKQRKPLNMNDKRIRKTKQNIRDALFQLLENRSLDQITVSEIVKTADINRSTFYFYYEDINDLFRQTNDEVLEMFAQDIIATDFRFNSKAEFVAYLSRFLNFCRENSVICKFVTSNRCNNDIADRIYTELKKVIPDSRQSYTENDPRYYLTTFAVAGFLFSVLEWIDDGMKITTDQMAEFLSETYLCGSVSVKVNADY